jgi:hypothetical protein
MTKSAPRRSPGYSDRLRARATTARYGLPDWGATPLFAAMRLQSAKGASPLA